MTPTVRLHVQWLDALYLLGVRTRALTYLLSNLLTQLALAYKAGNISETVEDRAKANGLYKVVHWLSIAPNV